MEKKNSSILDISDSRVHLDALQGTVRAMDSVDESIHGQGCFDHWGS